VTAEEEGELKATKTLSSELDAGYEDVPEDPMELSDKDVPRRPKSPRRTCWCRTRLELLK